MDPASWVDVQADRFEAAWKAGTRPRIEDYLAADTGPTRAALVFELLQIELYYRDRQGETLLCVDYEARLPEDVSAVRQAFGRPGRGRPGAVELPAGTALGEYRIDALLGRGGMALVYRAWHVRLSRWVAVKVLTPRAAPDPAAIDRFRRESLATARLTHPNLVTAFDAGEQGGTLYLVMELLRGPNLYELVQREGPLSSERAVDAVLQAARGLQHAHEQGVTHRDVKPANLVDESGTVKVLDLGLARFREAPLGEAPWDSLTESGTIMGTVDYMAPEQALDPRRADRRADVYGLGCTLYYLLTGRPPFTGRTPMERLVAHREQPIPSLPAVPGLDGVLRRLLAKSPAERCQSMAEVIEALEELRRPPRARWLSRRRLLFVGGVITGGLLAGGLLARRRRPPRLEMRWEAGAPLGHSSWVVAVAFLRDNRRGVSSGDDGAICFWDLENGRDARPGRQEPKPGANCLAVHPDGERLLSGHDDGSVRLWKFDTPGPPQWTPWFGHRPNQPEGKRPVYCVAVSADGAHALSGSKDGSARAWDLGRGRPIEPLLFADDHDGISAVALAPNGLTGLVGGSGALRYWDLRTGKMLWPPRPAIENSVSSAAILPDGQHALCTHWNHEVFLLNLVTQHVPWQREGHKGEVYQLALFPDGGRAVTGGQDGRIVVWDVANGAALAEAVAHPGGVLSVAVSADGMRILSGGRDHRVRLWDWSP